MQIKNTTDQYGLISILFHWLNAILVISIFALGFYLESLSWGIEKFNLVDIHASIGFTIVLLILLRVLWRLYSPVPNSITQTTAQRVIVHTVHFALLLLLVALFSSGYIMISSGGNPVELFGSFYLPELPSNRHYTRSFRDYHEILVWVFIGTVSLHVLAALFHHFVKHDETLIRMVGKNLKK